MPELAKHIEITRHGRNYSLRIDGEDFPWLVGESITVHQTRGQVPSITLFISAERITSDNSLDEPTASPVTDASASRKFFGGIDRSRTGPLARAEAARDQAKELLADARKALADNHATIEQLRSELAEVKGTNSKGTKVGTAYVEVVSDFSGFKQAVDRLFDRFDLPKR